MAATALLTANALNPSLAQAEDRDGSIGGLKEWTTDQSIEAESIPDEEAKAAAKKAKEEEYCIPIGEGENCW